MSEFMGQHRLDFARVNARQERIEEYDALIASDTGEVRVAVGRAARTIHDENAALRGEAAAFEKRLDTFSKRSVAQRGKSIEQWRDEPRGRPAECEHRADPH